MANDGWWDRHLGGQQTAPQRPVTAPQHYPPQGQPQYQQQPVQQPQYPQQQQPVVNAANLYEAAMHWQGGQATRTETQPCPKCGSPHFFSRSAGVSRGPAPAPTCYTCGFNGMFEQGDPAVWQAG